MQEPKQTSIPIVPPGSERNSRFQCCAIAGIGLTLIAVLWASCWFFISQDKQSTLRMYRGRQRTIVSYTGDLLSDILESVQDVSIMGFSVGPMATQFLENYITSDDVAGNIKELMNSGYTPEKGESLAYGNFIISYQGRPRTVMGYLAGEFKKNDDGIVFKNKILKRDIFNQIRDIEASRDHKRLLSQTLVVKGRPTLITTGPLSLGEHNAYFTLYADEQRILQEYGFFKRRNMALAFGAVIMCCLIGFGMVLLRSVKRGEEQYACIQESALALQQQISERERAETEKESLHQQLLHVQKMEAIGTLAGGIAHDFNNLLTVIMGNAEMGLMSLSPDDKGRSELNQIYKASERARDLTMKLLTFARKEKLLEKTTSINKIINEGLLPVLDRSIPSNIRIKTVFKRDLDPVTVDTNQIMQALLNICTNARDAMPAGGVITIETDEIRFDNLSGVHLEIPQGRWCVIQISDCGAGIKPEVLDKIFEPFFTTKPMGQGTGLGLAVTHGIITNHGGYIHAASEPDRGSVIKIYLPFASDKVVVPPLPAPGPEHLTILVVDDEEDVLDLTRDILETHGYQVLTAQNGEQAVALFSRHADNIAAAVIDLVMPGMDGRAVLDALADIKPSCKAIIVSGYSIEGQASDLKDHLNVTGFIQKPFNIKQLLNQVSRAIS